MHHGEVSQVAEPCFTLLRFWVAEYGMLAVRIPAIDAYRAHMQSTRLLGAQNGVTDACAAFGRRVLYDGLLDVAQQQTFPHTVAHARVALQP